MCMFLIELIHTFAHYIYSYAFSIARKNTNFIIASHRIFQSIHLVIVTILTGQYLVSLMNNNNFSLSNTLLLIHLDCYVLHSFTRKQILVVTHPVLESPKSPSTSDFIFLAYLNLF